VTAPALATANEVSVSPLEAHDREALARFLAAWPGEETPPEFWRRRFALWWEGNPYFAPGACRGFALRAGGRIVGCFGVVPIGFQLGGRDITAFASTTWRVEPAFRHKSLAGIASVLRSTSDSLLFVWTLNDALVTVLEALRFVRVPRPADFHRPAPSVLLLRPPPSLFRAPLGALAATHAGAVWSGARLRARGLRTERVDHAGPAFDRLWERTRGHVANTNPRTATFLNWHCFASAAFGKRLYGCWREGDLVGFLVGVERRARGVRVLECADLWTEPGTPGVRDALLARVIAEAWREGLGAIELPPWSAEIRRFARWRGFLPRRQPDRGEWVLGPPPLLRTLAEEPSFLCGLQADRYL
jgi:hypothetical protein